jgi:hypothetical protein
MPQHFKSDLLPHLEQPVVPGRNTADAIRISQPYLLSHAPMQAGFDVSDMQIGPDPQRGGGDGVSRGFIPYAIPDTRFNQRDPLTGFLSQSEAGAVKTEAERIGADRFGLSWPMIRAQRLHSGDGHVVNSLVRRRLAEAQIGKIFTPLEMPQDPSTLYRRPVPGHAYSSGGND